MPLGYRGQVTALATPVTLFSNVNTPNISANGNSGLIDMSQVRACWLSVFAPNAPTGTTPTLDVYYDQQDANGNLVTGVVHLIQLTALGATSKSFGYGIGSYEGLGGGILLSSVGRVQWLVGGTSPVWNGVTISLIGR